MRLDCEPKIFSLATLSLSTAREIAKIHMNNREQLLVKTSDDDNHHLFRCD